MVWLLKMNAYGSKVRIAVIEQRAAALEVRCEPIFDKCHTVTKDLLVIVTDSGKGSYIAEFEFGRWMGIRSFRSDSSCRCHSLHRLSKSRSSEIAAKT